MNILFLTSTLPRFSNDSQAPFVQEQAFAWKKARPDDQIYILAPHDRLAKKQERLNGITISRFCYWWPLKWQGLAYPAILPNLLRNPLLWLQLPFFLLAELSMTLKLIKDHRIELLFAHWVMPQGLISLVAHKLCQVPYGLKNYSSDLRVFHRMPLGGRFLARKIIQNSKVLFCENSRLRKEALDLFDKKSQANYDKKIIALSMGVFDEPRTASDEMLPRTKYDIGFIGRLTKKKGVDFFIQALRELKKRGGSFTAAIAGDGEERESLQTAAADMNIEFLGFVSDERKAEFFQQTKFCIFPSRAFSGDVEGLPVALLEALYFGKIVIASRDTNIELLPEWENIRGAVCLLNDPGNIGEFADLLQRTLILTDDEIADRTTKARRFLARYRWDNLIGEYIRPLLSSPQ